MKAADGTTDVTPQLFPPTVATAVGVGEAGSRSFAKASFGVAVFPQNLIVYLPPSIRNLTFALFVEIEMLNQFVERETVSQLADGVLIREQAHLNGEDPRFFEIRETSVRITGGICI